MTYGAYECREFVNSPILLQVALAVSTSTTRVAAMGKNAVTSGVGDANHLSVFQWRPRDGDEGWVLVRPPGRIENVTHHGLQSLGLRSATSLKLYSMGGYGPTVRDKREAAYKAIANDLNTTNENKIHMFLRLKSNSRCDHLFRAIERALPYRGGVDRVNHYINIVKDIDTVMEKLQPPKLRLTLEL